MSFNVFVSDNFIRRIQVVDYGKFRNVLVLKSCREPGWELINNNSTYISSPEEVDRVGNSRAYRYIKELVFCNDFDYMFTQTLNSNYDRFDLDNFIEIIQKRFKAYKRKNKEFIYLIIYEKHKNGAYHLHGFLGKVGTDLYADEKGHLHLKSFEDLGFNFLKKLGDTELDRLKSSKYVTKYITKDMAKSSKNQRYFHSKGLKFASRIYLDDFDLSDYKMVYENNFVKVFKID